MKKLVESNTRYLGKMVREENRDARVTPEITEKPQIMDFAKNEERSEVTETPKPEKDNVQTVRTEAPAEEETATAAAQVVPVPEIDLAPETLADYDYLMNQFFYCRFCYRNNGRADQCCFFSGRRPYPAKRNRGTADSYLSQPFTGDILRFKGGKSRRYNRWSRRLSHKTSFRNVRLSGDACDGKV